MFTFFTVIVLALFCLTKPRHVFAETVCEDGLDGLCFEAVQFPSQNMSLGLALPSVAATDAGLREFLAVLSYPLPYGYATFSMNENSSFLLATFGVFSSPIELAQNSVNGSFLVAEIVIPSGNDTLVPIGKNATISTMSVVTNTGITVILRCQECGELEGLQLFNTTTTVFNLSLGISESLPKYIGSTDFAILPTNASFLENVEFNLTAARFDNYTAMVTLGGFGIAAM